MNLKKRKRKTTKQQRQNGTLVCSSYYDYKTSFHILSEGVLEVCEGQKLRLETRCAAPLPASNFDESNSWVPTENDKNKLIKPMNTKQSMIK